MKGRIKSAVIATVLSTATVLVGVSQGVMAADEPALIDLETERAIYRAISDDPALSNSHILASCTDGVVTLHGSTDDAAQRTVAETLVQNIDGVTEVRNNIIAN